VEAPDHVNVSAATVTITPTPAHVLFRFGITRRNLCVVLQWQNPAGGGNPKIANQNGTWVVWQLIQEDAWQQLNIL